MNADDPTLRRLRAVVGSDHVLTDPGVRAGFERDWTKRFSGSSLAVVRPADESEVVGALLACHQSGIAVVPQGGNTGLVGGAVPSDGNVILSLTRLADLGPVDVEAAEVTVGAGATLASVQRHVATVGLEVGVDLAARDSATIGGMVATNAGGIHVLRHGVMRNQVRGLEAVLADGRVLRKLGSVVKDNVGYDLPGLLTGSEGTLAIITRVRLALVPHRDRRATAVVALEAIEHLPPVVAALRRLADLVAIELIDRAGIEQVMGHDGTADPFTRPHAYYVLVECAADRDPTDQLADALVNLAEAADVVLVSDRAGSARLWRFREGQAEAISRLGVPSKFDVAVPHHALVSFIRWVPEVVAKAAPDAQLFLFGHAAEANLHVNVVGGPADDEVLADAVLGLVLELGGSVSAEHGIGRAKARWLDRALEPEALWALRAIKQALDPDRILNPAVSP